MDINSGTKLSTQQRSQEIAALHAEALALYNDHSIPVATILVKLGISGTAFYRLLERAGVKPNAPRSGGGPRLFTEEQDEQIAQEYQQGQSLEQLATQYGCWRGAIKHALRRQGIPLRKPGSNPKEWPAGFGEELCAEWNTGMSQKAIAKKHGLSEDQVYGILRRYSPGTPAKVVRRTWHPHWKGGRFQRDGYVLVLLEPSHPLHDTMANSLGYVLEHRLVMAESLGRPLAKHETVHHKDGNRSNNTIGNLQLRQGKHGAGVIYHCADCGSTNVVASAIAD